ncbi:MAG: rhomboid family intramembrane serine protease, partial [Candidatus Aureabacteria bacterium]|nr:rhomboid family intramembrane serine protease [Candidatus Auribacterota bacterium]
MTEHKRASITMAAFKSSKYAGVFSLCFIMFVMYVMTNILRLSFTNQLMLDHSNGRWYQFLTALFCHRDYMHLSGNLFFLYIFGRLIEEEEGMTGFLISFMVCGIGSNFCDYFLSPHGDYLSLGSSGAVFGLFTIALLIKFKMQLTSFLELLIL